MSKRSEKITDFGKQCRKLRIEKGWSMTEVANKAGYRQSYIAQVESGTINPSIDFLNKSVEIYGLTGNEKTQFLANALSHSRRIEVKLDDITIIPKEDLAKLLAILVFNLEPPEAKKNDWYPVAYSFPILLREIYNRSRSIYMAHND
jgi:transcriptional regulator with XRE-family HTH domain